MRYFKLIILTLLLFSVTILAQYNGNNFALSVNYSLTTDSQIFLTPDAPNVFDREKSFNIDDIVSYSAELRYRLNESLIFGLSLEYIKTSAKGRNLPSPVFLVDDGFEVFPLELSAYYFLPFSSEDFKFYMGGGFGLYFGNRTRTLGNIKFENVSSEIGYGIQVSVGMDYMIFDNFSARGEIRFRDPDFKVTNKYSSETVIYDGREYAVNADQITSKINIDGITFSIGAAYNFNLF